MPGRNKTECLPHGAYVLSRDSGLTQGTNMYMAWHGMLWDVLERTRQSKGMATMLGGPHVYRTLREGP